MISRRPGLHHLKFVFGVGVEKCGTTSLFSAMHDASAFVRPQSKETFFFNTHYDRGMAYYQSQFLDHLEDQTKYHVDITPSYFRSLAALERISHLTTGPKILVNLRNPLKRAYSFYQHVYRIHLSQGDWNERFSRPNFFFFLRALLTEKDYYLPKYDELLNLLYRLFPPENIKVLLLEDMFSGWHTVAADLDDFLEFDRPVLRNVVSYPSKNETGVLPRFFYKFGQTSGRTGLAQVHADRIKFFDDLTPAQVTNALALQGSLTCDVTEDTIASLIPMVRDSVMRLEDMLDRDLTDWLQPFTCSSHWANVTREHVTAALDHEREHYT